MAKVKITDDNLRHCRCPVCPVQEKSECNKKLLVADERGVGGRLFCAQGKTNCHDFDKNQWCLCPNCLVWDENNLKSTQYCLRGNADEVD